MKRFISKDRKDYTEINRIEHENGVIIVAENVNMRSTFSIQDIQKYGHDGCDRRFIIGYCSHERLKLGVEAVSYIHDGFNLWVTTKKKVDLQLKRMIKVLDKIKIAAR